MTHRTTTTLWTNWQPKQPTYAPERSLPEKARLSICDQIDRRGGGRLGCVVVERKQRPIVMHVLSVEDCHRTVVRDRPALVIPNSNDSVPSLMLLILHDDETKIVRKNSQPPKHDIFYDCVVFASASAPARRVERAAGTGERADGAGERAARSGCCLLHAPVGGGAALAAGAVPAGASL